MQWLLDPEFWKHVSIPFVAAFVGGPVAMAYSRFDETMRNEAHAEYLASIAAFKANRFV